MISNNNSILFTSSRIKINNSNNSESNGFISSHGRDNFRTQEVFPSSNVFIRGEPDLSISISSQDCSYSTRIS
ncbi:hypothetical protein GIB67_042825 [Kingdonia uniflora]|uniref:Uncharacterized protein n=1 Tax=Kingdonia uniflora TaxID=39325 RepID=A0A7J7MHB6_9MAGN|nr:hypothetical protein GIB67_042825 [Kingdonia uniflora]